MWAIEGVKRASYVAQLLNLGEVVGTLGAESSSSAGGRQSRRATGAAGRRAALLAAGELGGCWDTGERRFAPLRASCGVSRGADRANSADSCGSGAVRRAARAGAVGAAPRLRAALRAAGLRSQQCGAPLATGAIEVGRRGAARVRARVRESRQSRRATGAALLATGARCGRLIGVPGYGHWGGCSRRLAALLRVRRCGPGAGVGLRRCWRLGGASRAGRARRCSLRSQQCGAAPAAGAGRLPTLARCARCWRLGQSRSGPARCSASRRAGDWGGAARVRTRARESVGAGAQGRLPARCSLRSQQCGAPLRRWGRQSRSSASRAARCWRLGQSRSGRRAALLDAVAGRRCWRLGRRCSRRRWASLGLRSQQLGARGAARGGRIGGVLGYGGTSFRAATGLWWRLILATGAESGRILGDGGNRGGPARRAVGDCGGSVRRCWAVSCAGAAFATAIAPRRLVWAGTGRAARLARRSTCAGWRARPCAPLPARARPGARRCAGKTPCARLRRD